MVKALLFDLDDTLLWDEKSVREAFKDTCGLAADTYNIDPVALGVKVRENALALFASYDTYSFTRMIGISPFEGLWGNFEDEGESFHKLKEIVPQYRKESWARGLNDVGIDDPEFAYLLAETFPIKRKKNALVYEDTFSTLDHLKREYQLLLLTNGSPDLQQTKLNLTPKLKQYFDHIVISGDFGKGKPDPAIFEYALGLLSMKKEEVIMVGDNLNTDILGASNAGIPSVWINHHGVIGETMPTYEISQLKELLPITRRLSP